MEREEGYRESKRRGTYVAWEDAPLKNEFLLDDASLRHPRYSPLRLVVDSLDHRPDAQEYLCDLWSAENVT